MAPPRKLNAIQKAMMKGKTVAGFDRANLPVIETDQGRKAIDRDGNLVAPTKAVL